MKVFAVTDSLHFEFLKDTVMRLTRNLCVVVEHVLLSLLCSHIIINAEDQILLVMFFLAVAERRVKLSTHVLCQRYFFIV